MANKEIGASLKLDANQANQTLKQFKQDLKIANAELLKAIELFGETSDEAAAAAKKVAEFKDRIGDSKALIDGFNPDRKFQALSSTISGLAGGFAGLQGALALVGIESEDVQKSLLKVQAALAISQGVNSVLELKDTFNQLGAVIKATTIYQKANNAVTAAAAFVQKLFTGSVNQTSVAFQGLKTAIVATGIGLLVVAIGFAISKINEWTKSTEDQEKAQERLKRATEDLNEAVEKQGQLSDRFTKENIAQAKARGASENELQSIERKGHEDRIYFAETALQDAKAKGIDTLQFEERLQKERSNLRIFDFDQQAKLLEKQRDEAKKALEKRLADEKAARDKFLQERIANEKAAEDQIKKLRIQAELDSIKDETERAKRKIKLENQLERERVNSINLSEKTRLALILEINKAEDAALESIDRESLEKKKARDAERLAANLEFMTSAFEQSKAFIQAQNDLRGELASFQRTELEQQLFELDEWYKARRKIAGDNEVLQNELTKEYERQRTAIVRTEALNRLSIVSSILGRAADLFGKQTAVGKTLAIAEATINTYAGATQALRGKVAAPEPLATAIRIAQAALIVATGIKSIKEIIKTKVPGTGGGATPATPSLDVQAPLTPQVGSTALNQEAINNTGNATVRAFVIETDVENQRERIERLNRAARLGG